MHENTEKYCIERVKNGDHEAFSWIVDHYKDMVYTLCIRMLNSPEDAEEAAQDVFVKVYHSLSGYRGASKLSTWIYRITYNQCISIIRRKVKVIDLVDEVPDGDPDEKTIDAFRLLEETERKTYLHRAMESLPETDAFVLTLFYLEELSLEEICEITGLKNNNVRTRLHRARKKLYEILSGLLKTELQSII